MKILIKHSILVKNHGETICAWRAKPDETLRRFTTHSQKGSPVICMKGQKGIRFPFGNVYNDRFTRTKTAGYYYTLPKMYAKKFTHL